MMLWLLFGGSFIAGLVMLVLRTLRPRGPACGACFGRGCYEVVNRDDRYPVHVMRTCVACGGRGA